LVFNKYQALNIVMIALHHMYNGHSHNGYFWLTTDLLYPECPACFSKWQYSSDPEKGTDRLQCYVCGLYYNPAAEMMERELRSPMGRSFMLYRWLAFKPSPIKIVWTYGGDSHYCHSDTGYGWNLVLMPALPFNITFTRVKKLLTFL
jgi:hypothetical protein